MRSVVTILLVIIFFSGNLFAKKVEVVQAKKAATTFVKHIDGLSKIPSNLELVYTSNGLSSPFEMQAKEATAYYYVFNFVDSEGYIVMSADDAAVPVLAYSTQKKYQVENQPDAFVKWMDKYRMELKDIIDKQMQADNKIEQQWTRLNQGLAMNTEKNPQVVNPLMTTTWDQMQYYHDLCPYDEDYNQKVATGCVATAMAQLMKYHDHPQNGEGYHTYNHSKYGSLSANFGATTYNWSSMPNDVSSTNNEVATLMYHCGVSLDMNYGPAQTGGSSTNSVDVVANALKAYFSYASSTQYTMRQNYSDTDWKNLLKDELNNARPMEYAGIGQGSGHAFVCDGYDASDYFHFNWGWSGGYDGYFHVDVLNPGPGGTGAGNSNYNQYQQIVYGIQPETGGGGGGGGTPPGEGSPLTLYSAITVTPNPIDFYSAFSVDMNIANGSGSDYTGDLSAAIFNSDGANVGLVETLSNVTLLDNNYYTVSFTTEGMPVTPGNYTIGVYSKQTGEEWAGVKAGDYNNSIPITINGPTNDIAPYSVISLNPNPIIRGEQLSVNVDIANYGSSTFTGMVSADLYTSQGEYEQLIGEVEKTMDGGYFYSTEFTSNNIDVEPGTYIIALWNKPTGGEWSLMGSTNEYPNPITVKVVAPGLQADDYENNDDEANAYIFNAQNTTHVFTTGSNTHIGTDYDFYKIDLDPNSKYYISARVHDSYNSGNGQTYTNDVIFSYNEGNGSGIGYDVSTENFSINGKSSISFFVAPYFAGQTGTYLLDVNVVHNGAASIDENNMADWLNIYPNPAKDLLHLEFSDLAQQQIDNGHVYNTYGQLVYSFNEDEKHLSNIDINTSQLESGTYILKIGYAEGMITRKFNVVK